MKSEIIYEYVCEYFTDDGYEDIIENDFSTKLTEVWPPKLSIPNCNTRLGVVRTIGNEEEGTLETGYAYAGDTEFDTGHKIPQYLLRGLNQ